MNSCRGAIGTSPLGVREVPEGEESIDWQHLRVDDLLGATVHDRHDHEVRLYVSMTDEEVRNLPTYGGPKYPPVNAGYPR